jgi:competence protein ComEA
MDRPSAPWRVLDETDPATRDPAGGGSRTQVGSSRSLLPAVLIAVAASLAAAAFLVEASGSSPSIDVAGGRPFASAHDVADESGPPSSAGAGGLLIVDVQGAVARPGVVRLVAGSRVGDAIAAAGGYGPRVAPERVAQLLNLAAILHDGDQVVVPSRDDPSTAPVRPTQAGGGGAGAGAAGPIDLNMATAEQLDALPGIGPVTAAKILAARDEQRFGAVDDLKTRKLVGAATFDKIQSLVTVR